VHQKEQYEQFRAKIEDLKKVKSDLDVRIIGSDVSLRAIDTAGKNMDHADI